MLVENWSSDQSPAVTPVWGRNNLTKKHLQGVCVMKLNI